MTTYTKLTYQVVFSGKNRHQFIPERNDKMLYQYLGGILKNMDCIPLAQGGFENHVHLVFIPSKMISLSKIVQEVKKSSHIYLKSKKDIFPDFQGWQVGYGGFSYSWDERDRLIRYVEQQKEHHQKISFEDEYIRLLDEFGVDYSPEYLFD